MNLAIDFLNILSDFGDEWVITHLESDIKDKIVYIHLEYKGDKYFDPDTDEECTYYDLAPEREWRHLDIWDYKTYVRSRIPRMKTPSGLVKTMRCGWAEPHHRHTCSFEIKVIDTLKATKNQTKTGALLGSSFRIVNAIMHGSTQRGLERRNLKIYEIEDISIDEKSFKKGHKYVTVISHPRSGCVLDVGEDRDERSTTDLLRKTFTKNQLSNIKTVCMDMWKSYMNAVNKCIPDAEIVHDKFHLIKYLNDAIDSIRRREVHDNEILKYGRYTLLKNEENRTVFQQELFEEIMKTNLVVTKAHYAKETFKSLFNQHNDDYQATESLKMWAQTFFMYKIPELNKVILQFLSHSKGVINAIISTFTNAMAERLNGKIQEIKVCSRGYRTFQNFRSAILFFQGGLNLYPLKW
ncbi:MAG: ISL3 family transposase [Saprospiraceae bacterium]|jgi:transposase